MDRRPLLTDLSDEDRAAALKRFEILQPFFDGEVQLTALAREHRVSLRTAQR